MMSTRVVEKARPVCALCGRNPAAPKYINERRVRIWRTKCSSCRLRRVRKRAYQQHKKESCELCGFIPVHPCQLDVDHKDGNKANCNSDNFQTLCANCHRLKTLVHKD